MTARTYAILNPNALGENLELDQGNLVVANLAQRDTAAQASTVFGTIPKAVGFANFDGVFWSESRGDLTGLCSIGVSMPQGSLSGLVGDDAYSWGLRPTEGEIVHNGIVVASGPPIEERTWISIVVNFDAPGGPLLTFYAAGNFYASVVLPTDSHGGFFWLPAGGIGVSDPGDIQAFFNFGQRPFPLALNSGVNQGNNDSSGTGRILTNLGGWYEINTEGIANLYLTITDEAIITAKTDEPASKQYKARVMNAESFSIRRAPIVWPWGDTSIQLAAYGSLQLDNYDGFYSSLVGADLRDSTVQIKLPEAMPQGTGSLVRNAPLIATAIIDGVTCDNEDVITITLKDTLARLDRPLPVQINPPFVDPGAANRMVPLSFGACRNRVPLLIDGVNRIYQLHDAPVNNLTAVRDKAAPLDPNATPPQYTPALSASGVQLQTDPIGKVTCDLSSVGEQVVIPGADDVLNGDGIFDSWSGSPSVPDGWDWSNEAGSSITRLGTADGYRVDNIARIQSTGTWYPPNAKYGSQLSYPSILESGKAYRITFNVYSIINSPPQITNGFVGGIMVRSDLSALADGAISPHGLSLLQPGFYSFEHRVPVGSDRDLIFVAVASTSVVAGTGIGLGGGLIYDVKVELLGEYLELPLQGMTLEQYFHEVLVRRAKEDADIYSLNDLRAIDSHETFSPDDDYAGFGIAYDEPPNILQALRDVTDSYGATHFTDNEGVIRTKVLRDPHDLAPIASFDSTNVVRPIKFAADLSTNLTTNGGARRNQSPGTDNDFVTDRDVVPAEVITRFKKTSQYTMTSSQSPAGQYDFSRNAPIFHMVHDDPADGQTEIDRIVGIYSPQVYSNGDVTTGKRRFVTFTALFDDTAAIGSGTQCDLADIGFGSVIELTYRDENGVVVHGFDDTRMLVAAWEIFPFARKLVLTGFC